MKSDEGLRTAKNVLPDKRRTMESGEGIGEAEGEKISTLGKLFP